MKRTAWVLASIVLTGMLVPAFAGEADHAFQLRFGGFFPSGDDSFWADNEDTFTLRASEFRDPVWGMTVVSSISNHAEVGFGIDFYDATVRSGYRDFVDQDGFAILHDTELSIVPLTVDFRFLPAGRYDYRGRGGRFRVQRPVFYLGAGIGANLFEYSEFGDFIDFADPDLPVVFRDYQDDGVAFEAHALAGVELPFGRAWSLVLEGKYSWSDTTLDQDFAGLGTLDLGGLTLTAAGSWRF
jgi:hypothetical protein